MLGKSVFRLHLKVDYMCTIYTYDGHGQSRSTLLDNPRSTLRNNVQSKQRLPGPRPLAGSAPFGYGLIL